MSYRVERRVGGLLFEEWEVVGPLFTDWDSAYAELMWRRDSGETVRVSEVD